MDFNHNFFNVIKWFLLLSNTVELYPPSNPFHTPDKANFLSVTPQAQARKTAFLIKKLTPVTLLIQNIIAHRMRCWLPRHCYNVRKPFKQ